MTDLIRVPIKGYEGIYDVDNKGNVYSVERMVLDMRDGYLKPRRMKEKVLKPHKDRKGYLRVSLTNAKGEKKTHTVHRIVADAFLPNPDNLPCINHRDETPYHNQVENLEWCTFKYNTNYGRARERISAGVNKYYETHDAPMKGRIVKGKTVMGRKKDETEWTTYISIKQASRAIDCYSSVISEVCSGKRKTAKGYVFKYADTPINYEEEDDE